MKLSVLPVTVVGTSTAICLAVVSGSEAGRSIRMGVIGWAGLLRVSGSQLSQSGISLERLVTISEKAHQVGGFGDPPNVSRSEMYAIPSK
jgi:hypothetical protein